jgi:hypothetical protein
MSSKSTTNNIEAQEHQCLQKNPFGHTFKNEDKMLRPPKAHPHPSLIKNMRMTKQVYSAIKKTIGQMPAERGGILLSISNDYVITGFVYDHAAENNRAVYQPNTNFLNSVLDGRNEEFIGVVHSHPRGFIELTSQDKRAAWSNLTSPGNPHLEAYMMPLIQTAPDTGEFKIIPYIVTCDLKGNGKVIVKRVELKILGGSNDEQFKKTNNK